MAKNQPVFFSIRLSDNYRKVNILPNSNTETDFLYNISKSNRLQPAFPFFDNMHLAICLYNSFNYNTCRRAISYIYTLNKKVQRVRNCLRNFYFLDLFIVISACSENPLVEKYNRISPCVIYCKTLHLLLIKN